ncbi:GNAT family N-acetyltransferase [Virgisporangium aliadipatigenens]|uniref:GNAT family N-acetyltransferase n=1 Tax=Virgisporangium aliadipatigenens TaxID=741659 RepID=A0A8J3YL48_9ACTN|nr:bifunctional GNAT family N-acetyltransferase/acetate--CoA ligase family protein [Virgisporangium aliadipatigenens]GIJ45965.1 GNAT family N-acetyltransferase [Virgisporangium aliadipatigenens]
MSGADVVLSDGATVHIRQITPEDADAVVAMHSRFSERTRYLRYFSPYPRIPARDLRRFVNVDHHDREALVAEVGGELIAVARYERLGAGADEAEVAFVVEDAHQGRGLGSVLLEHLAAAAAPVGIHRFVAEVLPANARMIRVFVDTGYEVARQYADGVVHLTFPIAPTDRSVEVQRRREQRAEARSVAKLLTPRAVAVYGARHDGTGLGAQVLRHLRDGGFTGRVVPVHRSAGEVCGLAAVAVLRAEAEVDLAVIVVPAPNVGAVVAECAAAGVTSVLVVSSGFDDAGRRALVRLIRSNGLRLIGPAALGVANTAIGLNATLAPALPHPGRVGFFSQSAALGTALLATARRRGIGLSTFVSAGERLDVSGNDLMQYWHDDPATDAVLLYLETFGNPRKFARIARELASRKPVVAVASAARSHGTRLDIGAETALFASSGVIRTETVAAMFDVGALVGTQPLPGGNRLGVVCDAEVFAALAAAAAPRAGLSVTTVRRLSYDVTPAVLADAVRAALADPAVDAVLVAYAPAASTDPAAPIWEDPEHPPPYLVEGQRAVAEAARDCEKPVLGVYPAGEPVGQVPVYPSVEEAVRALGRVATYAAWRREPVGEHPDLADVDPPGAALVVGSSAAGWTGTAPGNDDRAARLLDRYGIPVVPGRRLSGDPQDVADAAADLGFPVALKVAAAPWRHRVDLGAVRLDLATHAEVARAHADLQERFGLSVEVTVQRMATPGVACTIRAIDDPAFGPVVGFGLGGVATDLLSDMAWRPAPLTDRDAVRLLRAPKAAPILHGYRGTPPVDTRALADLLLRIGRMAADQPRLTLVDLNPVLAHERGLSVLGAEIQVGPPATRPDTGPRQVH